MRTIRDFFGGGDLLHLALLLSLLRVDYHLLGHQQNWHIRLENEYQIRNRVNPISQKVIDDLGDLGRFSAYGSPNIHGFDRLEVATYMLNSLTVSPDQTEIQTEAEADDLYDPFDLDDLYGEPYPGRRTDDLDSGVSDVGQLSDAETDSPLSPSNLGYDRNNFNDGILSPSSLEDECQQPMHTPEEDELAILTDEIVFPELGSPSVDHFDGLDWNEIESIAQFQSADHPNHLANAEVPAFNYENDSVMDLDLDFLDPLKTYTPDEEDVENQLIEIDNRLITLDGSIQNLNDGVQHLGEQLATAQTESDVESFLFGALDAEESSNDMVLGAVGNDADFLNFNDWEMDVNQTLNEIFGNPADLLAKVEVQVKEEPVTDHEDYQEVTPTVIKEEIKEDEFDNNELLAAFEVDFIKDDDSDFQSGAAMGAAHLDDHNYAAAPLYENLKYASSLESFGATADSPFSSASFEMSHRTRESRDERKARQLGIPFSISEIIDSPMEEFNAMMLQTTLTEEQTALCRDIRRRGKNKVAAQNCRRRKLDLISSLEDEVTRARNYKQQLLSEREELYRQRSEWSEKLRHLEEAVLRGLNKDVEEYSFQLAQDGSGEVRVTQRHAGRLANLTRA